MSYNFLMQMGRREKALNRLLDVAKGEREIHSYLKKYDYLILHAFNRAWNTHHVRFPDVLRHQFAKLLRSRGECSWCSIAGKFGSGAEEIASNETHIEYNFHVVIGRSSTLTGDERRYRQLDTSWGGSEIATYDRLLIFARKNDTADRETRAIWHAAGMKAPRRLFR